MTNETNRKPHHNFAGYRTERRNPYSGGHTIILDCKWADQQNSPLVADWNEEGGRYQVLCNDHSTIVHCTSMPSARAAMKDPLLFCDDCRTIFAQTADLHPRLDPGSAKDTAMTPLQQAERELQTVHAANVARANEPNFGYETRANLSAVQVDALLDELRRLRETQRTKENKP